MCEFWNLIDSKRDYSVIVFYKISFLFKKKQQINA